MKKQPVGQCWSHYPFKSAILLIANTNSLQLNYQYGHLDNISPTTTIKLNTDFKAFAMKSDYVCILANTIHPLVLSYPPLENSGELLHGSLHLIQIYYLLTLLAGPLLKMIEQISSWSWGKKNKRLNLLSLDEKSNIDI